MTTTPPTDAELSAARREAVDAELEAERLEGLARRARRRAASRMTHYENLLLIAQGQLTIPEDDE